MDKGGILIIYSNSPDPQHNLFQDLDEAEDTGPTATIIAEDEANSSYQFGPTERTTKREGEDEERQFQQDMAIGKLNSVADGKANDKYQNDVLQNHDWGHSDGGRSTEKINEARVRRSEEEIFKLHRKTYHGNAKRSHNKF